MKQLPRVFSFEWDDAKAKSNWAKHKVAFEYATRVFAEQVHVDYDTSHEGDGEARRRQSHGSMGK